jgi:GR25 family glycosyltransferase involved in LPS biosynthesis
MMNIIKGNKKILLFKYKLKKIIGFFIKKQKSIVFGSSKNHINKIFIINLDRQPDRWKQIKNELKSVSTIKEETLLNYTERFSAIDADKTPLKTTKINDTYTVQDQYFVDPNPQLLNLIREKDISIKLNKQEIAIALSHITIWEKIINENIQNALILEDDVYFENGFPNKLNLLWKELIIFEKGFDLLFLSYKKVDYNPEIEEMSCNLLIPKRGIWWFSGYVLSNKGAKKLLNKLPVVGPIDLWINHKFKEIDVFLSNESLINQKLFLSSDNNYSILPILSQIGIESNKTFIDLNKLKGRNPVFIFDLSKDSKTNLEKIYILLSLNSYRVYINKSRREDDYIIDLIKRREALLFDAYIGFNSVLSNFSDITNFYPNIICIIIDLSINGDRHLKSNQYNINKNLLLINSSNKNICKDISNFLKIKNWIIDNNRLNIIGTEDDTKPLKIRISNNYQYLEHDVNPWILPIQNIKKYLPYDINEMEINPIGERVNGKFDYFKNIDMNYWDILENTFPSNQSHFSKENLKLLSNSEYGIKIEVTNSKIENRQYTSSSIVSKIQYLYGCFEILMKPIKGNGIISAFFLHRNDPWQEIDIEFLGNDTTKILLNLYYNPGLENVNYNYGLRGTPILIDLGFDASEEFNIYKIEWEYHEIRWYVDDNIIHVRKMWTPTPIPSLPLSVYINAWITNSESLAGKIDSKILPKTLIVKHIKIFDYKYNDI